MRIHSPQSTQRSEIICAFPFRTLIAFVGQRFKQYREQAGLTQEELAEKVGLNSNYISRIERGDSFPRLETFVGLLNALEKVVTAIPGLFTYYPIVESITCIF